MVSLPSRAEGMVGGGGGVGGSVGATVVLTTSAQKEKSMIEYIHEENNIFGHTHVHQSSLPST